MKLPIDSATAVRQGEELNIPALESYLKSAIPGFGRIAASQQFSGGFSNLTYLIKTDGAQEYILRRPPVGANIKSAHDMGREFRVLSLLQPHYSKVPTPYCFCESDDVLGAPFYVMERVRGVILRAKDGENEGLTPKLMRTLSEKLIENLVVLHDLDIEATGLIQLGKPDGYVVRQVGGWIKRYEAAMTDDIPAMTKTGEWLQTHLPRAQKPAFIHNDYKYDNVVLDPLDQTRILAVLDWEMATVGDPLMDLGATLAYWCEAEDGAFMKQFNLTWKEGNLSRREVIDLYSRLSGRDLSDIGFYYVFGLYKNAVIAQQIYARWKKGFTKDSRFGGLIYWVRELSEMALRFEI